MESFYTTIAILTFGLVIYLMFSMPTKKEVRALAQPEVNRRRIAALREELAARLGKTCALNLDEVHGVVGAGALTGEIVDVDDEWVLVRVPGQKGSRLVAMRLGCVSGLEEQGD